MNYQPATPVEGPAYARRFRVFACLLTIVLVVYGISVAARFPLTSFSLGTQWLLAGMTLLLVTTCWFFINARVTITHEGIHQTWLIDKKIAWRDIRGVRMLGIPGLHHLFPPRLMVRTQSGFFLSFPGGSPQLLEEYARIAVAFQRPAVDANEP